MKVNLLCGDRNLPIDILKRKSNERWIGIDRGTLVLIEHKITPQFAVGDFDSINEDERALIERQITLNPLNPEKDDTDLALGVEQAIAYGYREIEIYGATGGRLDHFLGAIQILEKPEFEMQDLTIALIDDCNEIRYLSAGQHFVKRNPTLPYISFVPTTVPTEISLTHFKYNLDHKTLLKGSTLTISNEIADDFGKIEIFKGNVLVIRSRDKS